MILGALRFLMPVLGRYWQIAVILGLVAALYLGYRVHEADMSHLHAQIAVDQSQVVSLQAQVADARMVQAAQMAASAGLAKHDREAEGQRRVYVSRDYRKASVVTKDVNGLFGQIARTAR